MPDLRGTDGPPSDPAQTGRWTQLPPRVDPSDWVETIVAVPDGEAPVVPGDGVTYPSGTAVSG